MAKKVVNFEKMPTTADRESFLAMQKEVFEECLVSFDSSQKILVEISSPMPLDSPGLMFAATEWLSMVQPPETKKTTKKNSKKQPRTDLEMQVDISIHLLITQLQELSFLVREQRKPAISLWDDFQNYLQQQLKKDLPGFKLLLYVLTIIARDTELPISQNLKMAISEAMFSEFSKDDETHPQKNMSPAEINAQFDDRLEELENSGEMSIFGLADNLISEFQHLPTEASVMLIMQHFRSSRAFGYEAATLLVAHPDSKVRSQLISLYESNFTGKEISPVGLRRLIGLRNWLPVNERTKLDRLIKKVRQKGIECAPMPEPIKGKQHFYASFRDGVGAQMVWMFAPDHKRKRQFSSILSTFPKGIKDVMVEREITKSSERFYLTALGEGAELREVDAYFVQKFVEAGLAINLKKGTIPPINLLEVAESLGIPYWQPNSLDINNILKELYEKAGEKIHSPMIEQTFLKSVDWLAEEDDEQYGFTESWLIDDDPVLEEILEKELDKKARSGKKPTLSFDEVEKAVLNYLESNRDIWRDTVLWTALLSAHSLDKKTAKFPWEVFVLTADQIIKGKAFSNIPLMKGIAYQTTVNLAD